MWAQAPQSFWRMCVLLGLHSHRARSVTIVGAAGGTLWGGREEWTWWRSCAHLAVIQGLGLKAFAWRSNPGSGQMLSGRPESV